MNNDIIYQSIVDVVPVKEETQTLSHSPLPMTNIRFITGIVVINIIIFAGIILISNASASDTETGYPEEALNLGAMIHEKSVRYHAKQSQVEALQDEMRKLAAGAAGLDHTLCMEYGLKYVRSGSDAPGSIQEASDCPLE